MNKLLISKEIEHSINIESKEEKEEIFDFLNVKLQTEKETFFGTLHSLSSNNHTANKYCLFELEIILPVNQLIQLIEIPKIKSISILFKNKCIKEIEIDSSCYKIKVFSKDSTGVYITKIDF